MARRRSFSPRAWTWLLVLVLAPVTLLALLPTAVNLDRYVVSGDDLEAPYGRGAVLLSQDVPVGDVEVGDVLTYPVGGVVGADDQERLVTRRVSAITDGAFVMASDERPGVPALASQLDLSERATVARAVLAVPVVGYPFLGPLEGVGVSLVLLVLGAGLGGYLVLARPGARRAAQRGAHAAVGPRA